MSLFKGWPRSTISQRQEAYRSAINVLNVREWTAAAVLCRRLLEGVTTTLLPQDKQEPPLAQQVSALAEARDLAKPIRDIADSVRKGGNLAAHFDLEKQPDEETATLMLDLLEDLMKYIFIVPQQIEKLRLQVDKLPKATATT